MSEVGYDQLKDLPVCEQHKRKLLRLVTKKANKFVLSCPKCTNLAVSEARKTQ